MIVTMLVGAWFLIHQHCCFADAGSPRSILVDPLMRRSPLEKNFIRFGRSWPHLNGFETNHMAEFLDTSEDKANVHQDSSNWNIGPRDVRGKENFIRFGRTIGLQKTTDGSWGSIPPDHERSPLMTSNELTPNKLILKYRTDDDMFPRTSRSKQNFIRFGRSNAMLNKNKKYSGHSKDNFIRFGRGDLEIDKPPVSSVDNIVGERSTRGKDKGSKNSGFIRFGKAIEHSRFPEDRRDKRSVRAGGSETRCDSQVEKCKSCFLEKTLDPTSLVAPEFSLLPKIPFQHTPLKENFIRLG